jgi:heme A synthase
MPIYKRYYMADIPAFGWLADFYITRYVHYLGAALLLALLSYFLFDYFFLRRKNLKISRTGLLRIALLAGIVATGILFVVKNFPVHYFSHDAIIMLNLGHLGFVMAFLFVSLYCLVFKKKWTIVR